MDKTKNKILSKAMEGNKNALGNRGGRPSIYTDPFEIEEKIEAYFIYIQGERGTKTVNGKEVEYWIRPPEAPTVTGLSLALDFESKSTLYEYAKRAEFSYSIKRGLTQIEKYHELSVAHGDRCTGNIFVLKNMGWLDKREIDHKNNGGSFETLEQKKNRIKQLKNKLLNSDN